MTVLKSSEINVIVSFLGPREAYRSIIISPKEVFCSPHCQTEIDDGNYQSIQTPSGIYDISKIVDRLPPSQKPDLIIVKADSTRANFPTNLQSLSCPKLLICGNTQHLSKPIQTLVKYALEEEFDFIMSDHKRHHLHYFKEAGFENVFWVPGFNINPYLQEQNLTSKYPLTFVGQVGQFHPYRKSILACLKQLNFSIHQLQASQKKAAEIYAESLINLNISMNGDLNLRVFEVLSSGGFLLTDKLSPQSGLELLFEDNKHLALFRNKSELRQKINFFLENPQIAREIASNGCEAFWRNYKPELNIKRVLDYIDGKDIDPIYKIEAERRSIYIHSNDIEELNQRISIYEFIQEIHLKQSYIKVLCWSQVDLKIICDVIDLPRLDVNIICDDYKERDSDISINLFYQCKVEKQITFIDSLQLQSQAQSWDLIILTEQELERIGINQLLGLINFKDLIILEDKINTNGNSESKFDSLFERFGLVKKSNNPLAYSWRNKSDWGTFLLAQDKNVAAIRAFERALQDNPYDIKALVELGLLYTKLDDLTEAEKLLHKAVSLERRNPLAMENLAKVLMGLNKYDIAANILEYLLEIKSEEIELWSWLEKCYLQQALEQKALNIYRRCNYLRQGKNVDKYDGNLTESNPKITPKRILVINNLYPPQELGGYGRSISDFANILQQRGHTIKVLTSDAPYLTQIITAEPNINRNLQLFGTFDGGAKAIENPQEIQIIIAHNNQIIREVINEFAPDVCLVGNINFLGSEIFKPFLENYIPVINHLGLPTLLCSADKMPQYNYFILATASEYVRQKVISQGYPSEKTIIVYPGAKVKKFQMCMLPNMDKLRIVYAGLIIDSKGTHTLIEALKIIDDENIDFECYIAGDNNIDRDYFTRLKQFVVRNGMEEKVKFIGYLQLEELIHLYSSKNVIVFPSIGPEAFGISPIEGMAAGLTAISTGVGGGSETIEHNVSGLIFPAGDSFALAQTLIGLTKDVEKWQIIAATGKQKALNIFDIEHSVDILANKFEELLEQRCSDPKYLQNIILPKLKARLKLRNINLIIFPNWSQPEEVLMPELEVAIATFLTHPRNSQMTLLIDTADISEEEANLALSSIVMNLMMQENLEVSEESEISLLGQMNKIEWTALLPCLHGRIILANENLQAITRAKVDTISSYNIESLSKLI
ncbi:glycosyltransferase [Dapis sp. BLCC M126]|uniref:glycosyltransferase n=1 Tax=Dapis sp. BLCC M126 TaxID=3400189 RepID=UPI003CF19933